MESQKYSATFSFSSLEALQVFVKASLEWQTNPKEVKNDKRGQKTKLLHQKAKVHRQKNPKLTYRECLKAVSKQPNDN